MKEFYTRSITAIAYATVILLPLFYSEYLFYTIGFVCSLILVFEFIITSFFLEILVNQTLYYT